ncbi:hypothetical protein PWG15_10080 [Ensifer adhaerens]|uniref:hypothetical protein n=1 Tax=Ensifer adhaerens TaxID=106592 RepID=UPI0023A92D91|nr:hypothetical protein [Ensifer adhaerens]WDZ78805.1 hypothetical protein PWG15_10080 [Ensifer adhaerens]
MSSTPRRRAILPQEMKQIEITFNDILREQALSRRSEAAEWIAKRLLALYDSGVHDNSTLKVLVDPAH